MNHIYRLVWNELIRAWVAVAEIAKGRGKRSSSTVGHSPCHQRRLLPECMASLRQQQILVAPLALSLAMIGAPAWALDVNALPTGGKVVAGAATISQAANVLTVQQASQRAALDWQSFNIGAAATVNFVQPNSSAVALNRIEVALEGKSALRAGTEKCGQSQRNSRYSNCSPVSEEKS